MICLTAPRGEGAGGGGGGVGGGGGGGRVDCVFSGIVLCSVFNVSD